jgi:hypothetical protein
MDEDDQWCLLALLNSFIANYIVRLRVTTHVTTEIVSRLPAPRPARKSTAHTTLATLARTLAADGVDKRSEAYIELQATVAHLYELSTAQFAHVLSTFPLIDSAVRTAAMDRFQWRASL